VQRLLREVKLSDVSNAVPAFASGH
jgi:hypothetical protein